MNIPTTLACASSLIIAAALYKSYADSAYPKPYEIVAAVLLAEAGGDIKPGMTAVMEVIQNRAQKTVETPVYVVTLRHQFSCLNNTTPLLLVRIMKRHPRWSEAVKLARFGTHTNMVSGATHYHAESVKPVWTKGAKPCARIGSHVFYRSVK